MFLHKRAFYLFLKLMGSLPAGFCSGEDSRFIGLIATIGCDTSRTYKVEEEKDWANKINTFTDDNLMDKHPEYDLEMVDSWPLLRRRPRPVLLPSGFWVFSWIRVACRRVIIGKDLMLQIAGGGY
jgi:hypothetical protein